MQNALKKEQQLGCSQFQLTSDLLRNLYKYDLTPVSKLVLLELTTHLNENKNGSVVFPSVGYIAEVLGIGLTATKKAINDLIKEGLIIKSKRDKVKGNYNKYVLTLKVRNSTSERSGNEPFKKSDSDLFLLEQIKETKKQQKDSSGGNVYRDKILREYAIKNHAKNIDAFVNYLKNEGRDEKIIQDHEQKQRIKEWGFKKTKIYDEARLQAQQNRVLPHTCEKLNEVLEKRFGIKK